MTKAEMKEKAIAAIECAIWATEHMDLTSKFSANYYHAQAQGKIQMAYELEVINKEELDKYWDDNNQASYKHPMCFAK